MVSNTVLFASSILLLLGSPVSSFPAFPPSNLNALYSRSSGSSHHNETQHSNSSSILPSSSSSSPSGNNAWTNHQSQKDQAWNQKHNSNSNNNQNQNKPQHQTCDMSTISLPALTSNTSLPAPTGALKYIALGRGTQNYTCAPGATKPTSLGALATLYDASSLACKDMNGLTSLATLSVLVDQAVDGANPADTTASTRMLSDAMGMSVLGHHYFSAQSAVAKAGNASAATPTFNLNASGYDDMKGNFSTPAPASSSSLAGVSSPAALLQSLGGAGNLLNSGAMSPNAILSQGVNSKNVAWLRLLEFNPGSGSFKNVYRVATVGGTLESCEGKSGNVEVPYSALYWFYE